MRKDRSEDAQVAHTNNHHRKEGNDSSASLSNVVAQVFSASKDRKGMTNKGDGCPTPNRADIWSPCSPSTSPILGDTESCSLPNYLNTTTQPWRNDSATPRLLASSSESKSPAGLQSWLSSWCESTKKFSLQRLYRLMDKMDKHELDKQIQKELKLIKARLGDIEHQSKRNTTGEPTSSSAVDRTQLCYTEASREMDLPSSALASSTRPQSSVKVSERDQRRRDRYTKNPIKAVEAANRLFKYQSTPTRYQSKPTCFRLPKQQANPRILSRKTGPVVKRGTQTPSPVNKRTVNPMWPLSTSSRPPMWPMAMKSQPAKWTVPSKSRTTKWPMAKKSGKPKYKGMTRLDESYCARPRDNSRSTEVNTTHFIDEKISKNWMAEVPMLGKVASKKQCLKYRTDTTVDPQPRNNCASTHHTLLSKLKSKLLCQPPPLRMRAKPKGHLKMGT